jgi:antitoxin StbD
MILPSPSSSATNQPSTACHQISLPTIIELAEDAELNRIADERMVLLDKVSVSLDDL